MNNDLRVGVELCTPRSPSPNLSAALARYDSVALMVNKRELERFVAEAPLILDPDDYPEDAEPGNYNATEAMNFKVYEAAGLPQPVPREYLPVLPGDSEAGQRDVSNSGHFVDGVWYSREQLSRAPETFYGSIPGPLHKPLALDVLQAQLETLTNLMQDLATIDIDVEDHERLEQAFKSSLELPDDIREVYSLTNGVIGAGVPSETCNLELIVRLTPKSVNPAFNYTAIRSREFARDQLNFCRNACRRDGYAVATAWLLGRDGGAPMVATWYVYCRRISGQTNDEASQQWRWRVFTMWDWDSVFYDGIKDYLDSWTELVQLREGGARVQYKLC